MIKFKAKPFKISNSHAVVIPKAFVKGGMVNPELNYWFEIKSEEKDESTL